MLWRIERDSAWMLLLDGERRPECFLVDYQHGARALEA